MRVSAELRAPVVLAASLADEGSDRFECPDLREMLKLARLDGDAEQALAVEKLLSALSMAQDGKTTYYPSGRLASNGSSVYYESGSLACNGSSWYYERGSLAADGSSCYYANGRLASNGSSWYYPSGRLAESRRTEPKPNPFMRDELRELLRLARVAGDEKESRAIGKLLQALSMANGDETTYYPSGRLASNGSSVYYDSGPLASNGSSWYYESGRLAFNGSSWYYDNGRLATNGSSWYYPNGQLAG